MEATGATDGEATAEAVMDEAVIGVMEVMVADMEVMGGGIEDMGGTAIAQEYGTTTKKTNLLSDLTRHK